MRLFGAMVTSLSLLALACPEENREGTAPGSGSSPTVSVQDSQTISITRSGSQPSQKGSAEYFTGSVRIDPLFPARYPSRVSSASVTFEPGARTAWHTHPAGQILIVTAGAGLVQRWDGSIQEIRRGDVVQIPPGQKHWHGGTATTATTHIAIQEQVNGQLVVWMEKVSDEQYRAKGRPSATTMKLRLTVNGKAITATLIDSG